MFGNRIKNNITISLVLMGFCIYIVKLYIQNDINLYIHPRYSIFALVMCLLALVILIIGMFLDLKKKSSAVYDKGKIQILDVLAVIILVLAFIMPPQALSSKAIETKTLNTPTYGSQSENTNDDIVCPETKPSSIEQWVYEISQYPINCYKGQSIELTGFVYEAPNNPLPRDMFYLGRLVISCCVIDASPYALPIKTGNFERYPADTWLKVNGKLVVADVNGTYLLVIEPKNIIKIDDPNKPYEYINTPSQDQLQTIEPIM